MYVSVKCLIRGFVLLFILLFVVVIGLIQVCEFYSVVWILYVGFMFLVYVEENGILEKWGDCYGFDLEVVQMNDYVEVIIQFFLGQFDVVIVMFLDVFIIFVVFGVDIIVIMLLSIFNGSDGIVLCGKDKIVVDLKGMWINLVELLGFYYMLVCVL